MVINKWNALLLLKVKCTFLVISADMLEKGWLSRQKLHYRCGKSQFHMLKTKVNDILTLVSQFPWRSYKENRSAVDFMEGVLRLKERVASLRPNGQYISGMTVEQQMCGWIVWLPFVCHAFLWNISFSNRNKRNNACLFLKLYSFHAYST